MRVGMIVYGTIGMRVAMPVFRSRAVLVLMIRTNVAVLMLVRHAVDVRMGVRVLVLRSDGRRFARSARASPRTRCDQPGSWCCPHGTHKYSSAARRNARQPHAQRHPVW